MKQAWIDAQGIDREVAEEEPCPKCGARMEYRPQFAENSYRAFAVCVECGESIEF